MIDAIVQAQLLSPGLSSSRDSHIDLLLIDLTLDELSLGCFNDHCADICRLFDEDERGDEQRAGEGEAHVEVQAPGVACVEHVACVQGTRGTETEGDGVKSKTVRSFVKEKLFIRGGGSSREMG